MSSAASPGHSTSGIEPVLIFDLDGTILSINSFPHWVRYMLTGRFGHLPLPERVLLSLQTARFIAGRKILRRGHYLTKRRLQFLWAQALDKDKEQLALRDLSGFLLNHVRPNIRGVLDLVAPNKADGMLATSAAGEYAQPLGRELGFTHILTTPLCMDSDQFENCKERKRDRTLAAIAQAGWGGRRRVFFTDHREDLPLIKACPLTLWFGEDNEVAALKLQAPRAEIIPCLHLPDAEVVKLATA